GREPLARTVARGSRSRTHVLPNRPALLLTQPPPTPLHPLSLHDALPICGTDRGDGAGNLMPEYLRRLDEAMLNFFEVRTANAARDRKSTRLNSSHRTISYAVFCLKKKKRAY